ncbi:MAG: 3-hydroxybutyrate oligomer hydrolase family protein [Amphiplicatus sp.]
MKRIECLFILPALAAAAAGCGEKESAIAKGVSIEVVSERAPVRYDGETDDLLTGGLGFEGLNLPQPPAGASLRTKAIHTNYRALVDVTEGGGLTRLYGPSKDRLIIPGSEYVALLKLPGMAQPYAVAVAIPDSFNVEEPCLFIAPSSGSRGVYGAIGTAGAAGLSRGCAVAFTDKATGTGFVHLATGESYNAALALTSDTDEMLYAPAGVEAASKTLGPGAVAVKHAHSGDNVERFWGEATLGAGEYALSVLNRHFASASFARENTLILAVSISNGGKAAVMAAEADRSGLLDGVVASEPNLSLAKPGKVIVDRREVVGAGKAMLDYATLMNVYAPCAAVAPDLATQPGAAATLFAAPALTSWCARLAVEGLVHGETAAEQASDALVVIRDAGFTRDTDALFHYSVAIKLWPALAPAYVNAYGRYGIEETPCGAYYAFATAGTQRTPTDDEKTSLAALSGGIPPTAGIDLLYKDGTPNAAIEAALCFRNLWADAEGEKVRAGAAEAQNTGDYGAVPMIILHGRSDSLLPVNHTSRAYVGAAKGGGALRYYEIEGGQHFDSLLMLPDLAALLTPMEAYLGASVDLMMAHLKTGAPLPPSQLVRNTPRGTSPLGEAHLGGISLEPGANGIEIGDGAISLPQ